jgi:hypothetical protein
MPTYLLEGHFQLPAHNKPGEDPLWIGFEVATEKGLGFELSLRITDQYPAHRHGEQARAVYHTAVSDVISTTCDPRSHTRLSDLGALPGGTRIFGHHREIGQALALEARPPYLMGASWWGRLVERGIQPKTGDEGYGSAQAAAAK